VTGPEQATTPERVTRAETSQSILLWFGILGGPLAWTAEILVAADLAEVLCYSGAEASGRAQIYGVDVEVFLVALTAVLTLMCVAAGIVAGRCLLSLRAAGDATTSRRATWMARAGVLVSILFGLATVIGLIPLYLLETCTSSP
jgi:hypothetical protein